MVICRTSIRTYYSKTTRSSLFHTSIVWSEECPDRYARVVHVTATGGKPTPPLSTENASSYREPQGSDNPLSQIVSCPVPRLQVTGNSDLPSFFSSWKYISALLQRGPEVGLWSCVRRPALSSSLITERLGKQQHP